MREAKKRKAKRTETTNEMKNRRKWEAFIGLAVTGDCRYPQPGSPSGP